MVSAGKAKLESRLGSILLKGGHISCFQLQTALNHQSQQPMKLGSALVQLNFITPAHLKTALNKQSWLRSIAACIAISCAPIGVANASQSNTISAQSSFSNSNKASNTVTISSNVQLTTINPSPETVSYYYSGNHNLLLKNADHFNELNYSNKQETQFSFTKSFSTRSGVQLSLFSATNDYSNQFVNSDASYRFDPQISLFRMSIKPASAKYKLYSNPEKRSDHYSTSIPLVFMLSLKGRCLYENSADKIEKWSFDKAKHGVQRKAVLMFSVTKRF